jgi:CubicO group peptidase (beta-lactamase class C family)
MRIPTLAAVLTAFVLAACTTPSQTRAPAANSLIDRGRIDAALEGFIERGELVGTSALIFEHGREAYFGAFGLADREVGKPMARDTLVQIFSMTKPVTGVALMTLYEKGLFQLDDPLAKYAPEFADLQVYFGEVRGAGEPGPGGLLLYDPERPVTIRDLLRHTSGFADDEDQSRAGAIFRAEDPQNRDNTLAELAKRLARVPLLFSPGTQWRYGPSVDVQAYLVERLSGQRFDQFLQEHIFGPLRMKDTSYVVPQNKQRRLAAMYRRNDDGSMVRMEDEEAFGFNTREHALKPGGWGLVSSLDDYMRFARMLLNGGELDGARILRPETVQLMATDMLPGSITELSWLPSKGQVGFGVDFAVRTSSPASAQESSGEVGEFFWDGAANTLFWVDPRNEIAAVLFTQYRPFGRLPLSLHKAFRDAVYEDDETAVAR